MSTKYSYLKQAAASRFDTDLMSEKCGFVLEQLMELAGFSVAQSITKEYSAKKFPNVLVCVGPGNNGGDGLVAARHLSHFGYKPKLYYPKKSSKVAFYDSLLKQCVQCDIPVEKDDFSQCLVNTDLIIDAFFGFGFKPPIREPYLAALKALEGTAIPIVSVDVPSGWDVDMGPLNSEGIKPEMLVSLTAPKPCAKLFSGKYHYLGGRFVPRFMLDEYNLNLPKYPNSDQCVALHTQSQL
ncbi:NAD(P)H-hydrate epimerase [Zancudomyces culisetae]|uniref:NAD(P)H-hydrate epimerase n=1 Tax=Zancudomyces culisetae TaxID=1213189 RepID=A0A1R1PW64_ZANCU|nr:NAD(P)H-hydrate epimerase [Zancudomyces culisetae]|eukprot:OMH85188.1 NAD(P)H-hydrate epimerase [Zancudomyces culisetae]